MSPQDEQPPTIHFRGWDLVLGDELYGWHRHRGMYVLGTIILFAGCLCVSTAEGVYPLSYIAIHRVSKQAGQLTSG